jgi:hypothetical protein
MTMAEPTDPVAAQPRRRRRGLRIALASLGGLLILLALALVFLPAIAAPIAKGYAERSFAADHAGRLEIGELDLAWRERQHVRRARLFDPEGQAVLEADVELPSLWQLLRGRGQSIGDVGIVASGDLVADAEGTTNLQRALAPTQPARERDPGEEGEPPSWREGLAGLRLELQLTSPRLTWSDERTRALGEPFAVEDLRASASIAPGAPLHLVATGDVRSGRPGRLQADVLVDDPLQPLDSATPPRVKATVEIEGFSTGLVDGLARLSGLLPELIGPEFRLSARAEGTPREGTLSLELEAERARAVLAGELREGVFVGREGAAVSVSLDPEPGVLDERIAPLLPAGIALAREAGSPPLALAVKELRLPLDALPGLGSGAAEPDLSGLRLDVEVSLGDWKLSDEALRAAESPLELRGAKLAARIDPSPEGAGLRASVSSSLAPSGSLEAELVAEDAAALARVDFAELSGALGPLRARVEARNVPVALIEAKLGQGELSEPMGDTVARLVLEATASLVPGEPRAPGAERDWRDLARRASAEARFELRTEGPLAGGGRGQVQQIAGTARLEPDAPLRLSAEGEITAERAPMHLDAAVEGALEREARPRVQLTARLERFPTALVDALANQEGRLVEWAGPQLSLEATADGTLESGTVQASLTAERARASVAGSLADGVFRGAQGGALTFELSPAQDTLRSLLAGALPEGVQAELEPPLTLAVSELVVPIRSALDAPAADRLAAVLPGLELELSARLAGLRYSDETLRESGTALELDDVRVEASVGKGEGPAPVDLALNAKLAGQAGGNLAFRVAATDALELARWSERRALPPVELSLSAQGMPVSLAQAYAGGAEALREALGERADLEATAKVSMPAGGALDAQLELKLAGQGEPLHVSAQATVEQPLETRAEGDLPPIDLAIEISGAGALAAALPEDLAPMAREALGERVALRVRNTPLERDRSDGARSSAFEAKLEAARVSLAAAGRIEGGVLRTGEGQRLELSLAPTTAMIERFVAPSLPQGASLEIPQDGGPLVLRASEVVLPLEGLLARSPAEPAGAAEAQPVEAAALLDGASASIELDLPRIVYRHPGEGQPTQVALGGIELRGRLDGREASADLTGAVEGTGGTGRLAFHAKAQDPLALFAAEPGAARGRIEVQGEAEGLPTALVDALARQEGLLVDVIGPQMTLSLQGAWPGEGEPVRASMHAEKATVRLEASMQEMVLASSPAQGGLLATVPLSPLFSERVVGKLVPLLVNVRKSDDAAPVLLEATEFRLPLDGDLRKLDATVKLELGQVSYQLLAGLGEMVPALAQSLSASATIEPLVVRIEAGVARYDRLPLPVAGGKQLEFRGKYDLVTTEFDITTQVPLAVIRQGAVRELDRVREYLGSDLKVPIEIKGTWKKPRIGIGKSFLDEVVKKAAAGALGRGLEELLGGKKKKD